MSSLASIVQAICAVIALIITGIGAYYVIRSFRHQVTVNQNQSNINARQAVIIEQQIKMNNFEIARRKREIRPIFAYMGGEDDIYNFKLKNAIAQNISIAFFDKDGNEIIKSQIQNKTGLPDIYSITYTHKELDDIKKKQYYIKITFKDEDGTDYFQKITNGEKLNITFPQFI